MSLALGLEHSTGVASFYLCIILDHSSHHLPTLQVRNWHWQVPNCHPKVVRLGDDRTGLDAGLPGCRPALSTTHLGGSVTRRCQEEHREKMWDFVAVCIHQGKVGLPGRVWETTCPVDPLPLLLGPPSLPGTSSEEWGKFRAETTLTLGWWVPVIHLSKRRPNPKTATRSE